MSYAEQLRSPKWQAKRLEIMNRDRFSCTRCGDDESQLHVHHLYYTSGRKAWEYPNFVYQTLCCNCHDNDHVEAPQNKANWENVLDVFFKCECTCYDFSMAFATCLHERKVPAEEIHKKIVEFIRTLGVPKLKVDEHTSA